MRILYVNQFYEPDYSATAQLLSEYARKQVSEGCEVEVLASRFSYDAHERYPRRETLGGVSVRRCGLFAVGRRGLFLRALEALSFHSAVFFRLLFARRPDVVVSLTSPPMIFWTVSLACRLRGFPFEIWSMDIYPEVAFASGVLSERSLAGRVLSGMSRRAYRRARRVYALSGRMASRLAEKGVSPERIEVRENWALGGVRRVPPSENSFVREHGLDGKRVVLYSGNLGKGHSFEPLIGAAAALDSEPAARDVLFLIVGGGARLAETVERVRSLGLRNVRFLPYQPRERLAEVLSAASFHYVTLRDEFEGLIEPCKIYGILAAGGYVLFDGPPESHIAALIRDRGRGRVARTASEIAAAIMEKRQP